VHTQVSEPTLRRLTERAGAAYVAVQAAQVAAMRRGAVLPEEPGPPLQQVSVDGAMVPLVHKQWVEATTVAIGTVQPPKVQRDGTVAIETTDLSYFSRVAECHVFSEHVTPELVRRGVPTAGTVAGVVDGARWEQDFLDEQRADAVRILDWPHAVGSLSAAWLAAQREMLLHGDPQVVPARLRGLQDDLTLHAGEGPLPPALAVSRTYHSTRLAQIQYEAFRVSGYPIGSGIVEKVPVRSLSFQPT
jgi:hypothetical protein